jgi:hypothetical protein
MNNLTSNVDSEARCEGEVLSDVTEYGRDAWWWDPVLEADDAPSPDRETAPDVESRSIG